MKSYTFASTLLLVSILAPGLTLAQTAATSGPRVTSAQAKAKADLAFHSWRVSEGVTEFAPGLTFPQGRATVMLVATPNESGEMRNRRLAAALAASGFVLMDQGFDEVTICIASREHNKSEQPKVQNISIQKEKLKAAVDKACKRATVNEGISTIKENPSSLNQVCTELGVR